MSGVETIMVAPVDFELGGVRIVCTGTHRWFGDVRYGNNVYERRLWTS